MIKRDGEKVSLKGMVRRGSLNGVEWLGLECKAEWRVVLSLLECI